MRIGLNARACILSDTMASVRREPRALVRKVSPLAQKIEKHLGKTPEQRGLHAAGVARDRQAWSS